MFSAVRLIPWPSPGALEEWQVGDQIWGILERRSWLPRHFRIRSLHICAIGSYRESCVKGLSSDKRCWQLSMTSAASLFERHYASLRQKGLSFRLRTVAPLRVKYRSRTSRRFSNSELLSNASC